MLVHRGEASPKPKASARKKKGDSASSTTPPTPTPITTVVSAPRLSANAKGKQPARATTPTEPIDVQRTEAEQFKIVLKSSRQETHISQQRSFGTDEGTGVESIFTTASSPIVSLQTPTPIMTPITTSGDAPIPPTTIPSIILKNLPTFNSAFRFDERLRSLETSFSEYRQTNPFVDDVSAIPENDEFLRKIDENMKKIIKGQVKNQVKEQVSRILPRIEESVNAILEAEVLTRSSHSSRTLYAIAADLSEMELKKILIKKIEGSKSIQRLDEQQNLYKELVEAYDADKAILDTYGESTILKRRREDDDQKGPSAGSDRGSKRQKEGEEPVQTTCQMEEPPHPVFERGVDDKPIVQTSQHPEWFSQLRRPPLPDRDWNKTLPAAQGDAQSWIS
nr:hypothetical protein [Tanacetum cinerariifolium]